MVGRIEFSIAVGMAGLFVAAAVGQSPDPNSPRYKGVEALSKFLTSQGESSLKDFVDQKVSLQLRDSMGREAISTALSKLRTEYVGAQMAGARPEGPYSANITFTNDQDISFEMAAEPPHRFVRIGALGVSSASASGTARAAPPASGNAASFSQLDAKLKKEAAAATFSGVVLAAKDGHPLFHEAYGMANKKNGTPNRKDTKFNIGSINKVFTMVAVYQLVDAGKLSLDDTIGKYLTQFPASVANSVTVQHLLDHRSGWGAYWENPTWNAQRAKLRTLDAYMDFIKDIPLGFEPGTSMQYSNTGYEVLGAIVQKASGQSYYDYVREHIYKPAGMTNTDAYEHGSNTPNMAIGYTGGGYGEDSSSMLAIKGTAAGGGFSTATDMMRFAKALSDGKLVPAKYTNRLRRGAFAGGAQGVAVSLDMSVAGHTVVVLSNFDPPSAGRVSQEVSGILRKLSGTKQYRIGVGFAPHDDGIAVNFLVPDAPGVRGGLKPGDVIVALNGKSITDDPVGHFDAVLVKPDPIELKVRRGDELITIVITPEPMDG